MFDDGKCACGRWVVAEVGGLARCARCSMKALGEELGVKTGTLTILVLGPSRPRFMQLGRILFTRKERNELWTRTTTTTPG